MKIIFGFMIAVFALSGAQAGARKPAPKGSEECKVDAESYCNPYNMDHDEEIKQCITKRQNECLAAFF